MAKKGAKLKGKALASARKNIKKAQQALRAKTRKVTKKTARKTTSKTNKRKKGNPDVAKKGSRRKGSGMAVVKKLAVGAGVGVATELIVSRLGAPGLAVDLGYSLATTVGGKVGVYGNAIARQAIQRTGAGQFLRGNGNGNGAVGASGFA